MGQCQEIDRTSCPYKPEEFFTKFKTVVKNILSFRLILYSDCVQVANPLSGAKHKMFCVYLSLGKFI